MPPSPNGCSETPPLVADAVARLLDALTRYGMAAPGDRLLVAVSGGADSIALLHLLTRIAPDWRLSLAVAHLDHGLRRDAEAAARFVADTAAGLGWPCYRTRRDVADFARRRGMSTEAAGRAVRYAFFSDLCIRHGCRRVAVGHHRGDCAEQMLMNLARGSGPTGLAGIAPMREGWVIRPLIGFTPEQIRAYLSTEAIPCVEDPTNTDRRMTRNRIRHDVLPVIARHINPRVVTAMARTAEIVGAENAWIEEMAEDALAAATLSRNAFTWELSAPAIAALPQPLQRRALRQAVGGVKGDLMRITRDHVDAALDLLRRERGGTLHLPAGVRVSRRCDRLTVSRRRPEPRKRPAPTGADYRIAVPAPETGGEAALSIRIEAVGARVAFRETTPGAAPGRHSAGHCIAFFDMEKLAFPLILRNVAQGDRFRPLGMTGTQKIYKLLKDAKIERERRRLTPVLVSGGAIIWVPGVKMGQSAAVTNDTRRVLRADFVLPPRK